MAHDLPEARRRNLAQVMQVQWRYKFADESAAQGFQSNFSAPAAGATIEYILGRRWTVRDPHCGASFEASAEVSVEDNANWVVFLRLAQPPEAGGSQRGRTLCRCVIRAQGDLALEATLVDSFEDSTWLRGDSEESFVRDFVARVAFELSP